MDEIRLLPHIILRRRKPAYIQFGGNGYLGGDFPDYITRVDGVPAQTEILVFLHRKKGDPGDGKLIARLETHASGSWRVDNLNPDLKYDVVCRYEGYKDEIMSNISPFVE